MTNVKKKPDGNRRACGNIWMCWQFAFPLTWTSLRLARVRVLRWIVQLACECLKTRTIQLCLAEDIVRSALPSVPIQPGLRTVFVVEWPDEVLDYDTVILEKNDEHVFSLLF